MTTSKVVPYKRGFGPFAPEESYRAPGPVPVPRRLDRRRDARARGALQNRVDPQAVACVVLEPVQGEGGFIPMPRDFPLGSASCATATGSSTSTTRCRAASAARAGVGDRALRRRARPPRLGQSLGGGLPLAAVTGRSEVVDAVEPGGLGGTFGGNPVACAAAVAVLDEVVTESFQRRARELGERIRGARRDRRASTRWARVRGSGPCWRSSSSRIERRRRRRAASPAPPSPKRGSAASFLSSRVRALGESSASSCRS